MVKYFRKKQIKLKDSNLLTKIALKKMTFVSIKIIQSVTAQKVDLKLQRTVLGVHIENMRTVSF